MDERPQSSAHEANMSYHQRYRRPQQAMGDLLSTLATAVDVANDPYMPEVVCRIQQLKAVNNGQAVPTCADTPDGTAGIGQGLVMPALRAYVYAQQNTWVYPMAILAVVGVPFWLGMMWAEGNRRGGTP